MKVLVLGAGKMVEAILTGFKATEDLSNWMIYSPSGISAQNLAIKVGARAVSDLSHVKNPDWLLIGCKPQQLPELRGKIGTQFQESLHVSILAAVSESEQMRILGAKDLIRVMPNLPVEYNAGVSLISSTSSSGRLSSFQKLFSKLGMAVVLEEEELEELTLLTGSGPAFFYEFSKNLSDSFTSLSTEEREKLVRQVMLGSGKASDLSKKPLNEMINSVTSKAGVTISVLENWRQKSFSELIKEGILAGKKRSTEIRDSLLQK